MIYGFWCNAHDQYTNPLARTLLIALQVVRTSFGFNLRECMYACWEWWTLWMNFMNELYGLNGFLYSVLVVTKRRWFTVSPIHIINTSQKLKLCFILKKGQYFKDNTFLGFIKPYGRQVFPNEKEVTVLLLTRRVCFPVVF